MSDWSAAVGASDLHPLGGGGETRGVDEVAGVGARAEPAPQPVVGDPEVDPAVGRLEGLVGHDGGVAVAAPPRADAGREMDAGVEGQQRSAERRVGKESVSTFSTQMTPYH